MAELKTIAIDKILIADRERQVDENRALALSAVIGTTGQIHPIIVRATPAAKRPFTLVAGGTRIRAHELAGKTEIEALVRKLNKTEAKLMEIEENLFGAKLTKLERAEHVLRYRELWESEHGEVKRGGDRRSAEFQTANFAELNGKSAVGSFMEQVLDDIGLSRRAIEYAQFIGANLMPSMREAVRGTAVADNQSDLLKLAKLSPETQVQAAAAFEQSGDIKLALDAVSLRSKVKPTPEQEIFDRLVSTWQRASKQVKADFLEHIGATLAEDGE